MLEPLLALRRAAARRARKLECGTPARTSAASECRREANSGTAAPAAAHCRCARLPPAPAKPRTCSRRCAALPRVACALGRLSMRPQRAGLLLRGTQRPLFTALHETLTTAPPCAAFATSGSPLERRRARRHQLQLSLCGMLESAGAARAAAPALVRCRRWRAELASRRARCAPRWLRSCLPWPCCQVPGRHSTRSCSSELTYLLAAARCRVGRAARCAAAPPPPRGLASHARRRSRKQLRFPVDCTSTAASLARWPRRRRSRASTWCVCTTACISICML